MTALPPLLARAEIHQRLQNIFPEGTPNRSYCTRESTADVVFTMLYIGAIAGTNVFMQPKAVYRMTDEQAQKKSEADRLAYRENVAKRGFRPSGNRWYEDNSREQLRDEDIKEGLRQVGAIDLQIGLAVTANKPKYALTPSFAALFDPSLKGDQLSSSIKAWQEHNLSPGALARIALVLKGAVTARDKVLVTFPNGETRHMNAGLSSVITKAVIETFAPNFLSNPAVVFVSESGRKVVARDDEMAKAIGLNIAANENLPDIVLADLGPQHPRLVFVEVVHSDGPISQRRKEALQKVAIDAGFPLEHLAFVTAFEDRSKSQFKKAVDHLAWGSYAWFMTEPNNIFILSAEPQKLA